MSKGEQIVKGHKALVNEKDRNVVVVHDHKAVPKKHIVGASNYMDFPIHWISSWIVSSRLLLHIKLWLSLDNWGQRLCLWIIE